jgi:hypothetical protein
MLALLLNPLVRNILIIVALGAMLIGGYAYWASNEKAIGAADEKAKEEVIAIQHEQEVVSKSANIEQKVYKDNASAETLKKKWSQP